MATHLFGHSANDIRQLLNDEVDALEAGLFHSCNLFLDNGLKSHVGGKETHSDTFKKDQDLAPSPNVVDTDGTSRANARDI